jgi:hypothetical protein
MAQTVETWPEDVYPESYTLIPQSHTLRPESPLTRTSRTVRLMGDRWIFEMALRLNRERAQRLGGLLGRLRGPGGLVALWDLDHELPLGTNRDGSSLPRTRFSDATEFTDGTRFSGGAGIHVYRDWPLASEAVLAVGFPQHSTQLVADDNIGLGGRLYRLTRDAAADGLGKAVLYLHRPLLDAIAHGTTVVRNKPTSPFRLADDDQAARSRTARDPHRAFNLRFVEHL